MANEAKFDYTSRVSLDTGFSTTCAATTYHKAEDATLNSANHYHYPLGDFELYANYTTAPSAGDTVDLYEHRLALGTGGNDSPAPSAAYPNKYVGSFPLSTSVHGASTDSSNWQAIPLDDVPLHKSADYYIYNNTTLTLSAAWELSVVPKTYKPGT